jgi:serine/threonine protein kinase
VPTNPFLPAQVEAALKGRFKIGPELRVGGQGAVFRALRVLDEKGRPVKDDVALKLHLDPRQDIRVEREINAMLGLSHPSLAKLIEHGFCDLSGVRTRYVAWEYIDGLPLDHRLATALAEADVANFAKDVCSAIDIIWSHRIVHRDVNPKNIMVRTGGAGVLIDLGGARHLDETSVTSPGSTFGTVGYLSPEQYRAERSLTSASDIFSLGVVLLYCLTGAHPTGFDQDRLATSPPKCAHIRASATPKLAEMIDRMLQLRAAFRPSAAELSRFFGQICP